VGARYARGRAVFLSFTCRQVALRYTSSHLPPLLRPKPDPPPSTTVCPPPWRSATSFCLPPPSEQGRCSMWLFPHYIQSHTRPLSSPHIHIHIHIHKPPPLQPCFKLPWPFSPKTPPSAAATSSASPSSAKVVSALARFVVARDAADLSATLEPAVAQWGSSPSSLFTLYIEGLLRTCSVPVDAELLCRLTNLQIEALSHFCLDSNTAQLLPPPAPAPRRPVRPRDCRGLHP
jgi:hypothetical protein